MPRIRTIKPKLYSDRQLAKCPIQARYLFKALWVFADDLGIVIGDAEYIKSQIFPYDKDLRVQELEKWLDALVDARMIEPLEYKEESFYNIRTFRTHQRIDKPNYDDLHIPEKALNELLPNRKIPEKAGSTINPRSFDDQSRPDSKGEDRIVKESKGVLGTASRSNFQPPDKIQVQDYFFQIESSAECADKFFDYYSANGWRTGKNPMKDWQAAARNWLRNEKKFAKNESGSSDPAERKIGRVSVDKLENFVKRRSHPDSQ